MRRSLAFALALAAATPAPAQAPAKLAVDPAAAAAARELVATIGMRQSMQQAMDRTLDDMRSGRTLGAQLDQNPNARMQRAKNPQAWDAALARIGAKQAAVMQKVMAEMQPEMEARAVNGYATSFTADELRQMIAFYRTPLGRKISQRTPAISAETVRWTQSEIPKRAAPGMRALLPEIQREFQALMPQQPAPNVN